MKNLLALITNTIDKIADFTLNLQKTNPSLQTEILKYWPFFTHRKRTT